MFAVEREELRRSAIRRKEWKRTAEEIRALGDACIEIADQMEEALVEAETEAELEAPRARAG